MNYGLYLAASGLLTNSYRQDVIANNLANVNTTGFKPDYVTFQHRDAERIEDGLPLESPNRLLEQLGGGVLMDPTRVHFADGILSRTGNQLDLAVRGEGFLTFASGRGEGNERLRFSRDGRLAINPDGYLVHAATGMRLLDDGDQPIQIISNEAITISGNGELQQGGSVIAKIQLAALPDQNAFKKAGGNMFHLDSSNQVSRQPATGSIAQKWIEGSGVDPMKSLMEMNTAAGAVSRSAQMIRYHDDIMSSAINRFGRVT